jgi:LysR substrate binding domain
VPCHHPLRVVIWVAGVGDDHGLALVAMRSAVSRPTAPEPPATILTVRGVVSFMTGFCDCLELRFRYRTRSSAASEACLVIGDNQSAFMHVRGVRSLDGPGSAQAPLLRGGRRAAALREGRRIRALCTEPVCVALPARHPLAANTSVAITALANEPVLRYDDAHPEWNAFWTFDPRPAGSHPPPGPYVHDMEEIVGYVRAGRGVAFLPVPVTAAIAPSGVTFVPVDGIPPGQVALAWGADRPPPHISVLLSAPRDPSEDTAAADPGSRTGITSVTAGAGLSLQACAYKSVLRDRMTNLSTSPGRS